MSYKSVLVLVLIYAGMQLRPAFGENIITIGNFQATASRSFSINITLTNTDTIGGMQIPISLSSDSMAPVCDSVSFVGGRCEAFGSKYYEKFPDSKAFYILLLNNLSVDEADRPLLPGSGLICKVFLSLPQNYNRSILELKQGNIKDNKSELKRNLNFTIWKLDGDEITGAIQYFSHRWSNR